MPRRRGVCLVAACALVAGCSGGSNEQADQPLSTLASAPTTAELSTTTAPATTAASTTTVPVTTDSTAAPTTVAPTTAPPATTVVDPGAAACPTPPRAAPAAERPRYVASAAIDPEGGLVTGEMTVTFRPDAAIDRLVFRLWPNTSRNLAGGARLEVTSADTPGGFASVAAPDDTTLDLVLARPVAAGETVTANLRYRLVVGGAVRDRISRGPGWMRLGSFLPLLAWEPGRGWAYEPASSGFAEAVTSMVADYTVAVTVPPGYDVLGVGAPDAEGRWRAVAVRDMALSVGRFDVASATVAAPEPVTVTVGVEAGVGEDPAAYLGRVADALVDFAEKFGPYPWPSYTLAITPELSGGIEFPSHVMQGPGSIGRTTPHEVGHQWFYGLVGNNQGRDPVLDEGLATYAEARHEGTLGAFVDTAIPPFAAGAAGQPMTYWEQDLSAYYTGVYVQGAQAVAALGPPEAVDCALRRYVAKHAHQIATQADLVAAMEATFPGAGAVLASYGIGG